MKAVFTDSQKVEFAAKEALHFPPFLMMENAAAALEDAVLKCETLRGGKLGLTGGSVRKCKQGLADGAVLQSGSLTFPREVASIAKVLIVCGSGNNGGDGYALARRIHKKLDCTVVALSEPKTEEAIAERGMAVAAGVEILTALPETKELKSFCIIVDCILGTGFTGTLRENIAMVIDALNRTSCHKIACDVPSGFAFKADCTVTMGCLKTALFTDTAKEMCGKIITADLGVSREVFEGFGTSDAFLLEESDSKLPLRKNKAAHKGTFGHTAVFAGEKSGAGIIAATAALNFGSGLSSLVQAENSNLAQFKITPELMISDTIPASATSVLIGSGLGRGKEAEKPIADFCTWFCSAKNPSCVLDADIFYYEDLCGLLENLNAVQNSKIIVTPHPKELKALCERVFTNEEEAYWTIPKISENRIEIGKKITARFPNVTVVMKSANTFIASGKKCFICAEGAPSLAKAGSGDVLAGMCAALLAQGYTACDAAITAVYAHASASQQFSDGEGYDLTPEKLIDVVRGF